jgi:hypothetical protein
MTGVCHNIRIKIVSGVPAYHNIMSNLYCFEGLLSLSMFAP